MPLFVLEIDLEGGRIGFERADCCDFVIREEVEGVVEEGRGGLNAFGGMVPYVV